MTFGPEFNHESDSAMSCVKQISGEGSGNEKLSIGCCRSAENRGGSWQEMTSEDGQDPGLVGRGLWS